jgi:DNA-binding NarL/FixJ family response regulator
VRIVALVGDLMDRSRITAALPDATFTSDPAAAAGADVVVIDLGGRADAVPTVREVAPGAWIVAFGSHVDTERLAVAAADGADRVLPRSRFFQDPAAAVASGDRGVPPSSTA